MENIITIDQLNYLDIYDNLSLTIQNHTYYCLSGPNNCGKTTLIRILEKQIKEDFPIIIHHKKISEYKTQEIDKIVQAIIPFETEFLEDTVELELLSYQQEESYHELIKKLKIARMLTKKIKDLSEKEIILLELMIAIMNKPMILLIDSIDSFFTKEELNTIHNLLKDLVLKEELTVLETTINLENSLYANTLGIIQDGKIVLEGDPQEILVKDNVINKIGLRLPFMIDLSVKLKDYDLIDEIELDKDRMVDKLWK